MVVLDNVGYHKGRLAKDSLPDILLGLWLNIRVLAVSAVLIVVVGLAIAALRTLRGPLWSWYPSGTGPRVPGSPRRAPCVDR